MSETLELEDEEILEGGLMYSEICGWPPSNLSGVSNSSSHSPQ